MGHSRLGYLPQSFSWQDLIAQLARGADAPLVADATMRAASEGLQVASRDPGLRYVVLLLIKVVAAAALQGDFALALRDAGVAVAANPALFELLGGISEAVDDHLLKTHARSDFSEMAQMAAIESLSQLVGASSATLYGTTAADVRDAVTGLATERGFATLAHEFFTRFTERFLTYHLSRELSAHVGPGRRFANVAAHGEFLRQLHVTCAEAAIIIRRFAGDWYSKTKFQTGFGSDKIRDFVHGAFRKLRAEFATRAEGRRAAP